MNIEECNNYIRKYKLQGSTISNFNISLLQDVNDLKAYTSGKCAIFCTLKNRVNKAFFVVVNDEEGINDFADLMSNIPQGTVVEWFQKGEVDKDYLIKLEEYDSCEYRDLFKKCGLELYKKYIRVSSTYNKNPKSVPEIGRRKILWEMYEPSGEWPSLSDADELYKITAETFDPLTDDVYSIDEWKRLIEKKECLVCRENGEITAYYVWRLEGKKLYSNIALNRGPANNLYNIERRVFEEYWNKGIRSFYAWFDIKNKNALKRGNINPAERECLRSRSVLYNYIYIKV